MERANLLCTPSIFAIFIATGCNDSYNTVPIATSAKNVVTEQVAQRIRDAVTLDKPSLIVVESHAESWEQFRSLVVELVLVNPLRVPVSYDGFTPDSSQKRPEIGDISPIYQSRFKDDASGEWQDCSPRYCGNALRNSLTTMIVRPKQAGRFQAMIHPPLMQPEITSIKVGKVGFACYLD